MSTQTPVAVIISEAMRRVAECRDQLSETVDKAKEAVTTSRTEYDEAVKALAGLKKLHSQATASTRKREQGALERARGRVANRPTDVIADCLSRSLDMLPKNEIKQLTGLSAGAVGVALGKGIKSGVFCRKLVKGEEVYGMAQALARELSTGEKLAAAA